MAVAGVYGVTTYTTSRRTQEIGVRMALGATPRNVQALVFRQGFLIAAIGLASGLGLALVLIRVLRGVLLGLDSRNAANVWIEVGLVAFASHSLAGFRHGAQQDLTRQWPCDKNRFRTNKSHPAAFNLFSLKGTALNANVLFFDVCCGEPA